MDPKGFATTKLTKKDPKGFATTKLTKKDPAPEIMCKILIYLNAQK